jgi:hypothetical protein
LHRGRYVKLLTRERVWSGRIQREGEIYASGRIASLDRRRPAVAILVTPVPATARSSHNGLSLRRPRVARRETQRVMPV